jgi:anti-sigma regulatory factor (Ser/Thr protein kinase)
MNGTDLVETCALSPVPREARHQLRSLLESRCWPGNVDSIVLAVHEALTNADLHAGGATSATAVVEDSSVLVVEVRDRGPGFDVDRHATRPPDPMAERGRGLWLITQTASDWELDTRDRETCLRLRFSP